jgi:hypothetical protein
VDEITHLMIEKLLLTPTEQLKSAADADTVAAYADALTRLFALAEGDGPSEPARPRSADAGGNVEAFERKTPRVNR